jgi:uncharacterized protein (DUF58 family)
VTRRKMVTIAVAVALGLSVGLLLSRLAGGVVLLVYVLGLGALLLALLLKGLRSLLPPAVRFERLLARPETRAKGVEQLQTVERHLSLSIASDHEVHFRLRPMVREMVSVRLSRRYGIDLDREPERAEALIGAGRVWALIRPDVEAPAGRISRGWPRREMEQLVDELERL